MDYVVTIYSDELNKLEVETCHEVYSTSDLCDRINNLVNYHAAKDQTDYSVISVVKM